MRHTPYTTSRFTRRFTRRFTFVPLDELVKLIGTKDAAEQLGVSHKWIKRWMKQNAPGVKRHDD